MNKKKITVYLAGDSTVQSYGHENAPLTGWGEVIHEFFREEKVSRCVPCPSDFTQAVRYETDGLFIDNRAMAGRSSRSFYDEGRLADIDRCLEKGDYLFAQFAHNDANEGKPERFVTPDQYEQYLLKYKEVCDRHGAQLVLVTAIAMRSCGEERVFDVDEKPAARLSSVRLEDKADGTGYLQSESAAGAAHFQSETMSTTEFSQSEAAAFSVSFPAYRERMLLVAQKYDIPVLDLGLWSAARLNELGPEESKELFLWLKPGEYPAYPEGKQDNAHTKRRGAVEFAGILAQLIRAYAGDGRLDPLKEWLK